MRPGDGLGAKAFANATVMPAERYPQAKLRLGTSAWLNDGSLVEEILFRRRGRVARPPEMRPAEEQLTGRYVYGGLLFDRYGHFLVESLARYWYIKRYPRRALLWHRRDSAELLPWQEEILAMLDVPAHSHNIVLRPTRVEHLIVPQLGAEVGGFLAAQQVEALAVYPFQPPDPAKRVWISRSSWQSAGVEGERELEEDLRRRGWRTVHPETLSVREQLEQLSGAALIAGFDGSAFHTLLLARDVRARVVIVPRRSGYAVPSTFDVIAEAKGLHQEILDWPLTHASGAGRSATHALINPSGLAAELDSRSV